MREAYITVMALYRADSNLFNGLLAPEFTKGDVTYTLDKDVLVNNIILRCGEFEPLYPDPEFFGFAIGAWAQKEIGAWNELFKTLYYDYDPISNYDRTETRKSVGNRTQTDEKNRKLNDNVTEKNDTSENGTQKEVRTPELNYNTQSKQNDSNNTTLSSNGKTVVSGTTNSTDSGQDVLKHEIAAFNQPTPLTVSQQDTTIYGKSTNGGTNSTTDQNIKDTQESSGEISGNETRTETGKETKDNTNNSARNYSGNRTVEQTETETGNENEDTKNEENIRAYGNIGVTTTQQMIMSQRDVVKFNMYDYITDAFLKEFMLLVY